MNRAYHRWHSSALRRDMELLVFGYGGARLLAFPRCEGRFYDWEDHGIVAALAEHLEKGWLQLFCVDPLDGECWFAGDLHPRERAARYGQYDRYLRQEVVPFTMSCNPNPFLITAGTDFGPTTPSTSPSAIPGSWAGSSASAACGTSSG
jgi:esterase/lipase superfamily enzyme